MDDRAASPRHHALRGARLLTTATLVAKVVGFAGQLALARLLEPGDFGLYVFAVGIATLGVRFASFDARRDVLRCSAAEAAKRARAYVAVQTCLGLGVALALACFGADLAHFASSYLSSTRDQASAAAPLLVGLAFLPFFESLRIPLVALLEREQRYARLSALEVGGSVLQVLSWIVFATLGFGAAALVIGAYAATLLRSVIAFSVLRTVLGDAQATTADYRSVRSFGTQLWLCSLAMAAFWSGKDVLAGSLLGMTQAGYFGMAFEIPRAVMQVAEGWSRVALSLLGRGDDDAQRRVVSISLRASAFLLGPFLILATLHGELVVRCAFGERWLPCVPALRAFAILATLEAVFRVWSDLAALRGRPELPFRASFATALLLPVFAVYASDLGQVALCSLLAWLAPLPFALAWGRRQLGMSLVAPLRPAAVALLLALVSGAGLAALPWQGGFFEALSAMIEVAVFIVAVLVQDRDLAQIVRDGLGRRRVRAAPTFVPLLLVAFCFATH